MVMMALPQGRVSEDPLAITQQQLDDWLHAWQVKLELKNWNISVRLSHPGDLERETLGVLHINAAASTAAIAVLDPHDYGTIGHGYELLSPGQMRTDAERSIVHELVHLELSTLPVTGNRQEAEEQVVQRITSAFMGRPIVFRSK